MGQLIKHSPLPVRQKLRPSSRVKVTAPKKIVDPFYTSTAWRALVEQLKMERFGGGDIGG